MVDATRMLSEIMNEIRFTTDKRMSCPEHIAEHADYMKSLCEMLEKAARLAVEVNSLSKKVGDLIPSYDPT